MGQLELGWPASSLWQGLARLPSLPQNATPVALTLYLLSTSVLHILLSFRSQDEDNHSSSFPQAPRQLRLPLQTI